MERGPRLRAPASFVSAFVLTVLIGGFAVAPVAAALPIAAPAKGVVHPNSTNWAGFAVTGPSGSVSAVNGSWIVPKIQGTCPSSNQYSSFWVGIDGYSSNTVEQTGTDSDCQGGAAVYYAWFEFYPRASVLISSLTISAGDTISASVVHTSGTAFTLKIADVTTGHSFTKSGHVSGAKRTSAEWIAEAPSSFSGILPLADFGTVSFGKDYTSVAGTNSATVSGHTGTIASFTAHHSITMVNSAGTATKASPSAISSDGTSFTVTWKSAGP